MGDLRLLPGPKGPLHRENVLAVLAEMLEQARRGELSGVAVAGVRPDGSMTTITSATDNAPALLGAVSRLAKVLNDKIEEM